MAKTELKKYLFENDLKLADFALILNCSRSYLSAVANGGFKPGKRLAKDIHLATHGKVSFKEDVYDDRYKKNKHQEARTV